MKAGGYRIVARAAAVAAVMPVSVFAASVAINEIAWMGTAASANHEWIELHNTGSESADLTGWVLTASDGTPSISLQGNIVAGGFFLLERTSDDTVPGIAADQIYTGALGNTGETLILKDAGGLTVHSVIGGENWAAIGGNNETKETAQRVESGWITATGTPRAATVSPGISSGNTAVPPGVPASASPSVSSVSEPPASSGAGAAFPRLPSIAAHAAIPQRGVAGVEVLFSGEAVGLKGEPLLGARFRWSFGDGGSADGQKVFHAYHYPGTYAVFLDVASGEWSATARGEIIITPAKLRVSRSIPGAAGLIELANDDAEEINLSFWHLRSAGSFFTIPANTVILPKRSASFPSAITKLQVDAADTALLYPNGTVAVRYEPKERTLVVPTPVLVSAPKGEAVISKAPPVEPVAPPTPPALQAKMPRYAASSSAELLAAVGEAKRGMAPWMLGAAALVVVSVGGYLLVVRTPPKETSKAEELSKEAEQYDLTE